jgi:hypothetical protein
VLEYEVLQPLFQFMKMKSFPKKHRSDVLGWEMCEHIYAQVLQTLKASVMKV